jgi:hypothetical protein
VSDQLFQLVLKSLITMWDMGYLVHHADKLSNEARLLRRAFDALQRCPLPTK